MFLIEKPIKMLHNRKTYCLCGVCMGLERPLFFAESADEMSWNLESLTEAMITQYLLLPEVIWGETASTFTLQFRIP